MAAKRKEKMTRDEWKPRIEQAAKEAGTYQPFFDDMIDTLAGILETRDKTEEQFKQSGGNAVMQHTNKGGATNVVKNPLLVMVNDLNATALTYWRDLGLTPKGYRQLSGKDVEKKGDSFEQMLSSIGA